MRNNRNISFIISVLFILFGNLCCFAQKDVTFKLSRADSGHYMFPVMLNGEVKASALLESGIHAMLVDSAFAFEMFHNPLSSCSTGHQWASVS